MHPQQVRRRLNIRKKQEAWLLHRACCVSARQVTLSPGEARECERDPIELPDSSFGVRTSQAACSRAYPRS